MIHKSSNVTSFILLNTTTGMWELLSVTGECISTHMSYEWADRAQLAYNNVTARQNNAAEYKKRAARNAD